MATIKDLFKQQNKELYGLKGKLFIESRGLINAPRAAALLTSSPIALADLIGNQLGGALGGSANRPSDTIFKNNTILSKPISLGKTGRGLQDVIEKETNYFVKKDPAPANIFAKIKQGGSSVAGTATSLAIGALNKFGSKQGLNELKKFGKSLKDKKNGDQFGPKFGPEDAIFGRRVLIEDKTFSKYYKNKEGELTKRINTQMVGKKSKLDTINYSILSALSSANYEKAELDEFIKSNEQIQTPYVLIKRYNKPNDNILLPGTISGITDEATPEWSTFKFVGSPFNQYRYKGVDRKLSFELKMYYTDNTTKVSMIKNLDKLRTLVYPEEDISVTTYTGNNTYSPLGFNGNFINLTINGLYTDLFGFIETLSISIDDATPWATTGDFMDGSTIKPYPTVINVAIGMAIVDNPKIDGKKYVYNFTGDNVPEAGIPQLKARQTPNIELPNIKY